MACNPLRWLTGLIGGAFLGAAAGVLFAPQIYAAFKQVRRELADCVSDAGDAVEDLHDKGRGACGKVLNVIIHGAEDVEGKATDALDGLDQSAAQAAARRS